jgi:hypothetical protein
MVKTSRTRHSSTGREPMTIELGPDEVSRVQAESDSMQAGEAAAEAREDIGESVLSTPGEPEPSAAPADVLGEARHPDGHPEPFESAADPAPAEPQPGEASRNEDGFGRRTESPRTDAQTAQPRASRASALGAGVAGGIAALAVGAVLNYAGLIGAPGAPDVAVPAALEAEIAGLKSEVDVLKSASGAPTDLSGVTGQIETLSQGLEQVRADVAALQQAVQAGGADAGAGAGTGIEALNALNAKIAEIESRIASIGPGADGASSQDIAALGERIAAAEALAKSATDAGSAVDSRIGALEQSISALSTKVDAQAGQPKIALAIAASALKAAIERGSPFQPEIATFAAIAPDAPGLADLRAYAENGVATRADLVAETEAAAQAMIAAANPPPANAGFFERLLSSAESLVSVRPIGAVEGAGVPETVARMEVALQAGDLAKAAAEFETLPEAAKAAGAPFAERIKARLAAEQLADQAIAAAMQAA